MVRVRSLFEFAASLIAAQGGVLPLLGWLEDLLPFVEALPRCSEGLPCLLVRLELLTAEDGQDGQQALTPRPWLAVGGREPGRLGQFRGCRLPHDDGWRL